MPGDNPPIIAERSAPARARRLRAVVLGAALTAGTAAAAVYAGRDLTLSHYDARAHVMVARRITDSLTPGWRQIGGVWLPLPHLINAPIVQSDWSYRTGLPSTAVSVGAMATGLAVLAGYLLRRTGSMAAAVLAPTLVLLNPNVLYLQSTPMTEPLLVAFSFGALAAVDRWMREPTPLRRNLAGVLLMALMLTRYEGWCVAGALLALAAWGARRRGARAALALAPYCATAVLGFLLLSWGSTGRWFIASGFFVPDNPAFGHPWDALAQVAQGTYALGGGVVLAGGVAGLLVCVRTALRDRGGQLPLALLAAAALPWFAFVQGHPYRVRYMVPVVVASAVLSAVAVARLPERAATVLAVAIAVLATLERPPLDARAPMVLEAQWETPFRLERESVTRVLVAQHDGTPILASMGSLGHYMQETSAAGLPLSTFLHEGNGHLFTAAVGAPGRHVRWVLIEERAEGGDTLSARARADDAYLAGFARLAEGGGLVLFGRR
jgi:hypothetical protein